MKYLILILTAICLYSCASPITSLDQVEIYNFDMVMQVDGDSYKGYNITEEDILDFGIKKEVILDTASNKQIVKYINQETGNTLDEYVYFRKASVANNLMLDLGEYTNIYKKLNNYIDSIYYYKYDSLNVRAHYRVARLYSHTWQKVEKFKWSLLQKVGEYAPVFDLNNTPQDSIDKWQEQNKSLEFCDFSKVIKKVWSESQGIEGKRRYRCRIFINDKGQFTQMYCTRKMHNFDLKLIMDCLISFDYSNFLTCMKAGEEGFDMELMFVLGNDSVPPHSMFLPVPKQSLKKS